MRRPAGPAVAGLARLWLVVLAFVGVALWRSHQVGIGYRDPHGEFWTTRVALTVGIALGLAVLDAAVRTAAPRRPTTVWQTLRARWTPARTLVSAGALLAYHVTYLTYHNLKSWNDLREPRDAMLTAVDQALFAGHSPAVLLHDLLGQHAAAWVLTGWYEVFGTLVVVAFPAAVVLAPRVRDALAGIAAFVWVWILGTATYHLIPSIGPFHERPQDFAALPRTIVQQSQDHYLAQRAELLAHPQAPDSFAQLAAFASLHVGVTATILGLAWWHGLRRTTWVLTVFLAGTLVATVYLGWHFAVDLPAGLLIAWLAWLLGPLTVGVSRPRRPPRTRPESPHQPRQRRFRAGTAPAPTSQAR